MPWRSRGDTLRRLGENARYDEYVMGHTAMRYKIPFFTTLAAADASLEGIRALREERRVVRSLQEYYSEAGA